MVHWSENAAGTEIARGEAVGTELLRLGELLPQVLARHGLVDGSLAGGSRAEQTAGKAPERPGERRARVNRGRRARRRAMRSRGGA